MKIFKNQTKILIWTFVVSGIVSLAFEHAPTYITILYVIKYLALFLVYAIVAFALITFVHSLISESLEIYMKKQSRLLEIGTIVILVVTLGFISTYVVKTAETNQAIPEETYFTDEYNNILYQNLFSFVVPEITVITKTSNSLHLEGEEFIEGTPNSKGLVYPIDYPSILKDVDRAIGEVIFSIDVKYDEYNNISQYELRQTFLATGFGSSEKIYRYISSYKEVNNTHSYNEDGSISNLVSIRSYVEFEMDINTNDEYNTLEHYEFTDRQIDDSREILTARYSQNGGTTIIDADVKKKIDEEIVDTIDGSCRDGKCIYDFLETDSEIPLEFLLNDSGKEETIEMYGYSEEYRYILYSFYRESYNKGLITSNFHYREYELDPIDLRGKTYLYEKLFSVNQFYVEIEKTEFGFEVTQFNKYVYGREQDAVVEVMFNGYWSRDTNEDLLSYDLILKQTNIYHKYTYQNNPLLVLD